jgi:NAD/NADP transhydrogenase beta subunit
VSIASFVLFLCIGAALLAIWLVMRFPDRGPSDLTWALLHVALSIVLGQLIVASIGALDTVGVPAARFVAAFGIVLHCLTYMFVAAAWLIRATAGRLQGPGY